MPVAHNGVETLERRSIQRDEAPPRWRPPTPVPRPVPNRVSLGGQHLRQARRDQRRIGRTETGHTLRDNSSPRQAFVRSFHEPETANPSIASAALLCQLGAHPRIFSVVRGACLRRRTRTSVTCRMGQSRNVDRPPRFRRRCPDHALRSSQATGHASRRIPRTKVSPGHASVVEHQSKGRRRR
jgi:hypothetical protein